MRFLVKPPFCERVARLYGSWFLVAFSCCFLAELENLSSSSSEVRLCLFLAFVFVSERVNICFTVFLLWRRVPVECR